MKSWSRKKILIISVCGLILLGGAYFAFVYFSKKEEYVRTPKPLSRDVVADAGNMTFQIKGIDVALTDGTATVDGIPGTLKMMSGSLEIDFNKDRIMDRAVIIKNERSDGTVYFYVSGVIVGSDGALTNTNTILLGEGVQIQKMKDFPENIFTVDYLERKNPKDAPTIKKNRTFKVEGYTLSEVIKK